MWVDLFVFVVVLVLLALIGFVIGTMTGILLKASGKNYWVWVIGWTILIPLYYIS